jgi:hypothetical protein
LPSVTPAYPLASIWPALADGRKVEDILEPGVDAILKGSAQRGRSSFQSLSGSGQKVEALTKVVPQRFPRRVNSHKGGNGNDPKG